eukprot:10362837-Alexandrium_andersonii.AAC.1
MADDLTARPDEHAPTPGGIMVTMAARGTEPVASILGGGQMDAPRACSQDQACQPALVTDEGRELAEAPLQNV